MVVTHHHPSFLHLPKEEERWQNKFFGSLLTEVNEEEGEGGIKNILGRERLAPSRRSIAQYYRFDSCISSSYRSPRTAVPFKTYDQKVIITPDLLLQEL